MTYDIKYRNEDEMKDSVLDFIGDIPKKWDIVKLKKILSKNDGGAWGIEPDEHNKTIVLRSTEQKSDGTLKIINPAKRKLKKIEIIQTLLLEGDILITKSSGSELHIGKASYITEQVQEMQCCFSNFMQRLRIGEGNSKYYYYIINGIIVKKQFVYLSTTTTGLSNINADMINNVYVPATTYNEQKKIANFLDLKIAEFDSIISKKEDLTEKLEEAKKSLISEVVTGKVKILDGELVERKADEMRDNGVEWLGMIPKDWEVKKIKHISKLNSKNLLSNINKKAPISYIDIASVDNIGNINEIQELIFEDAPSRARRIVCYQDTIVSTVRTYLKAIAFIDMKYDGFICSTGFAVFTPIKKLLNAKYFYYVINSEEYINQIVSRSTGVSYPAINASQIANLSFILPTLQEQGLIIKILEYKFKRINSIITKTKLQIQKLKQAKQSLISEAVTGKIDLRDWEIQEI